MLQAKRRALDGAPVTAIHPAHFFTRVELLVSERPVDDSGEDQHFIRINVRLLQPLVLLNGWNLEQILLGTPVPSIALLPELTA